MIVEATDLRYSLRFLACSESIHSKAQRRVQIFSTIRVRYEIAASFSCRNRGPDSNLRFSI